MDKLLRLAMQQADQADVYFEEGSSDNVSFVNGKLDKADTSLSYGIALRVIKNGRVGLAHTRNLLDRQALVEQALASAENGMEVNITLPLTSDLPAIDSYDPAIESVSKDELVASGQRLIDYVAQRTQGQFNLDFGYTSAREGIMNSAGTELSRRGSHFVNYAQLVFPGTGSGLLEFCMEKSPVLLKTAQLDRMLELYRISETQLVPPTGPLPVIFTPYSLFFLFSRFFAAASPVSFYNKVSPLLDKYGERIFSEQISIRQDPFDPLLSNSTAFDGEGTPTRRLDYVDKGVFKCIPTDLNYAQKLGLEPTGNGFRGSHEAQPSAQPINICIDPGTKTLEEMTASLERGLIVYSLMGGHSGNILNGDYSVGVSSGFYVEHGKIVARVKDCLLSGNLYDTLNKVEAVESATQKLGSYKVPSILCRDISVAGK